MKNILKFILILIPWFISGILFPDVGNFYDKINLPIFALPDYLYGIVWTILYILIAISIYKIYKEYNFSEVKDYNKSLILNYITNQLYTFILFRLNNLFLAFVDTILILITALSLYDETKKLNEKASKLLIPYILFTIFAVILSLTIYFMNIN